MQLTMLAGKPRNLITPHLRATGAKLGVMARLAACWLMTQGALAAEVPLAKVASAWQPSGEKNPWVFAFFRQRYEGRVEIDADGRTRTAPLPNPMKEEQSLVLAQLLEQ